MSTAARLPQGVELGGLGNRIGALLLDLLPVLVLEAALAVPIALADPGTTVVLVLGGAVALLLVGWGVFVWFRVATTGASPGMHVAKIELVGYRNGRPLGWGRTLLRYLLFCLLTGTGIGFVLLVVLLIANPLRQGWHDQAVGGIVIRYRSRRARSSVANPPSRQPATATVGLPAHLRSDGGSFAPREDRPTVPGPAGVPPGPAPFQQQYPPAGQQQFAQPGQQQFPPAGQQQFAQPGPQQFVQPAQQPPPRQPMPPPGGQRPPMSPPMSQPSPQPAVAPSPTGAAPISAVPGFGPPDDGPDSGPADSTRLVPKRGGPGRAPDEGWSVALDDGRQLAVTGLLLLGRDPTPRPGETVTDLVSVSDNARMVSKTHVAVGVDAKGIYVMDRGSTNGTALAVSTGGYEPCPAGEIVRVREGQIVSFGDHRFEVRRSY